MRTDRSCLFAGAAATVLAGLVAGSSLAGGGPAPAVTVSVNGEVTNPTGVDTGSGVFNYSGSLVGGAGEWAGGFDFNASAASGMNGMGTSFLSGNFVVTNTLATSQNFEIVLSLPVSANGSLMTLYGGSVAGSLVGDSDGGTFDTIGSDGVWTASTNGTFVAELLTAPISVSVDPFKTMMIGAASFGEPIPNAMGPDLDSSLEITLRFALGAGDSAAFTSVLVAEAVPAPGALALLGAAGLVSRRRRRN